MASSKVLPSTTSGNPDLTLPPSPPSSSTSVAASSSLKPSPPNMISNSNVNNYASSSSASSFSITDLYHQSRAGEFSSAITTPTSSMAAVDGLFRNVYGGDNSSLGVIPGNTLLDTEITLIDAADAISADNHNRLHPDLSSSSRENNYGGSTSCGVGSSRKTVDDVWREIVGGSMERKGCKVENPDEMMTLEDFLAKAGAVEEAGVGGEDVKGLVPPLVTQRVGSEGVYAFDPINQTPLYPQPSQPRQQQGMVEGTLLGFGNHNNHNHGVEMIGAGVGGRGKKGGPILEPLDKTAQQRQRRMIKNRESAARSRERKQAYQVELETLAGRLEEENEQLLREKVQRTKERYKQLMEKIVPVVEKRRPPRPLRRVRSMQW